MKKPILLTMFASLFGFLSANAEPLKIGDAAPAVTATTHEGKSLDLAEVYKTGLVLVYFYPKADTGGCTKQACSLRDAYSELEKVGVRVIGVSTDSVQDQKAFHEKYRLNFPLIADTEKKVVQGFGVPARIFASRQAFLIKEGKVVWRDLSASTAEQAADVLAAVKQLGN